MNFFNKENLYDDDDDKKMKFNKVKQNLHLKEGYKVSMLKKQTVLEPY